MQDSTCYVVATHVLVDPVPTDNIKFMLLGTTIMFVHETIGNMKLCHSEYADHTWSTRTQRILLNAKVMIRHPAFLFPEKIRTQQS